MQRAHWIMAVDAEGMTPLSRVARAGEHRLAEILLATLRARETGGQGRPSRTLHELAAEGTPEELIAALDTVDDVDARDAWGLTPLHWACLAGRADLVEVLRAYGADPAAVDMASGRTPSGMARVLAQNMPGHEASREA
jgi:ankyrin repeat protein